ncbi:MAG: hypothetical protein Q3979_00680 [Actinomycetaceae bacterium]|nr:hypothetical protein [Actinomycetaceae bacterium]
MTLPPHDNSLTPWQQDGQHPHGHQSQPGGAPAGDSQYDPYAQQGGGPYYPGQQGQAQPGQPQGQFGAGQLGDSQPYGQQYDQFGASQQYGLHGQLQQPYGQFQQAAPPPQQAASSNWDDGGYKPGGQDPIPLSKSSITLRPAMTSSSLVSYLVVGGFGAACLYGAVWNIVRDEGTIAAAIALFVIGVLISLALLYMMSVRTVLDAQGIHLRAYKRSRSFPWPTSRTSFFVRITQGGGSARNVNNGADAYFVTEDGQPIALSGLSWRGPSATELEVKGVRECTRIWQWAVARGYTRETGQYVPIKGGLGIKQALRDAQEGKFGLR